jgi:uncharacterized protein with NAD-binding domain and iron-sulfur cluster
MNNKKKLVILGGGVGSMAAAWQLTSQPNWQDIYDSITVYQIGWRLCGKGASGRGPNGRIQEHGLHIWMGFYDNAFDVMRNAYPMLDRPPGSPLAAWTDAFKKHSYIVIAQNYNGKWYPWSFDFPENSSVPGRGAITPDLWQYLLRLIDFIIKHFRATGMKLYVESPIESDKHQSAIARLSYFVEAKLTNLEIFVEAKLTGLEIGAKTLAQNLLLVIETYVKNLSERASGPTEDDHQQIILLLEELLASIERHLKEKINFDLEIYRFVVVIDLAVTIVIGLLRDRVLFRSDKLDSLDQEDFREWLTRHEAFDETVNCDLLRGYYDLVFAYHNGDIDAPSFAAGTAIRCLFRILFSYKGAIFWKMEAGMGDTIFAPLYVALKKRGVTFKFFHRVQRLGLSEDKKSIKSICIARQATVNAEEYDPFVRVNDLDCWPATPNYGQLREGQALRDQKIDLESFYTSWKDVEEITLHSETDFDDVVFGISLASVPYLCRDLLTDPKWQAMANKVETVRTMAFQVWMNKNLQELGWDHKSPVMDAFVEPMDTWADMSQLIGREEYPAGKVKNISYFCGSMQGGIPPHSESQTPERALQAVTDISQNAFKKYAEAWWPQFDENCVVDYFFRANIDPSERYVQSTKGSTQYRLSGYQSGFSNLYLAGDWTLNGLNAGCVEAATISGKIVGNVLSGNLPLKDVWGYGDRADRTDDLVP